MELAAAVVCAVDLRGPVVVGVLAGLAVTFGAVAAAARLRLHQRRAQAITALVVGPLLLVGSVVALVLMCASALPMTPTGRRMTS